MVASLFCEKYGIDYALIEKNTTLRSHPAAHLINLRSMEILNELKLYDKVKSRTEDINYF